MAINTFTIGTGKKLHRQRFPFDMTYCGRSLSGKTLLPANNGDRCQICDEAARLQVDIDHVYPINKRR